MRQLAKCSSCPLVTSQVFVATNDSDLQITSDTNRAYIISGRRLLNEIREANKEVHILCSMLLSCWSWPP